MLRAIAIFCIFLSAKAGAQTYSGSGGLIPDDGTNDIEFSLTVSGLSPSAVNDVFGLETVCVNIQHTYNSDLTITLISPDNTEVILSANNGADSDNYSNTCFNHSAASSITSGSGPFSGTYRPQQRLGNVNNGQNGNGTWKLRIYDYYITDQGNLISWKLTFGNAPAPLYPLASSNLPIVIINTGGPGIADDPKIMADMGIIYNGPGVRNDITDPFNNYNGKIGIEQRGSSSSSFPKKSYGFETWNNIGLDTSVSLIGMPAESDWILSASYSDKSLMNNVLSYKLFNDFGNYAPRTRYVELIVNQEYLGVYVLMEKIKRDSSRVDIAKLKSTDIAGNALTGGYLLKIDKNTGSGGAGWTSAYAPMVNPVGQSIYFQYEYPSGNDIQPEQEQYIQSFVGAFETALFTGDLYDNVTGWRSFADESSFIKYFILNELSKNVDGYRLSTYLYKEKFSDGGKLSIGPPWDYDLGWHNADYCNGSVVSGWAYRFGDVCGFDGYQVPAWWGRFMQDTLFKNNLRCTYSQMRQTCLNTTYLYNYIDSVAAYLNEAQQRNFETWPILGTYVWPNPWPQPATYAGEVQELKTWIQNRLNWLDANIPGNCATLAVNNPAVSNSDASIIPNPFEDKFKIELNAEKSYNAIIKIYSIDGIEVFRKSLTVYQGLNIFYHYCPTKISFKPPVSQCKRNV
ncbi:MAG: CotH kinase family protein, partial [Cytophagaceae bacterium]|nr:CotH kinase family protein [Cytophagaceae bacterium]